MHRSPAQLGNWMHLCSSINPQLGFLSKTRNVPTRARRIAMAGLVHQVTGLSPRPRAAHGSSGANGQNRVVVRAGRARPGRAVAAAHVAAGPRYCRLRVAASSIAVPDTSNQLVEQQHVRPGNTASNQLIATVRFASILA